MGVDSKLLQINLGLKRLLEIKEKFLISAGYVVLFDSALNWWHYSTICGNCSLLRKLQNPHFLLNGYNCYNGG